MACLSYPTGNGVAREFFVSSTMLENHQKMDARVAELSAQGVPTFRREKIGGNATCPCGSLLKFKKCCIGKAR
ncbi:MAG: SEC-C metal-binding domain-containing protein [Pseudomonadota bacterium]